MGTYISQADLEARFGARNVAVWSCTDPNVVQVNTARIASAITYAEGFVEDRFRGGRYAVPFAGTVPGAMKDWMVKLAARWLYDQKMHDSGEDPPASKFEEWMEQVTAEIRSVVMGAVKLDIGASSGNHPTAPFVAGVGA